MLYYKMEDYPIHVGRKNGDPKPEILIGGIGILPNHAVFERTADDKAGNVVEIEPKKSSENEAAKPEGEGEQAEEFKLTAEDVDEEEKIDTSNPDQSPSKPDHELIYKYTIKPKDDKACSSIFLNGDEIKPEGAELSHMDRIIFGNYTVFLFKNPGQHESDVKSKLTEEKEAEWQTDLDAGNEVNETDKTAFYESLPTLVQDTIKDEPVMDWEFAQKEKSRKEEKEQEIVQKQKQEEHQKKMNEMNDKIEEEKKQTEMQIKQKQDEYEKQVCLVFTYLTTLYLTIGGYPLLYSSNLNF